MQVKNLQSFQLTFLWLLLLFSSTAGDWFRKKESNLKYAYGCLASKKYIDVSCEPDEIITVTDVSYGAEPDGCTNPFTDENDCRQYSQSITTKAKSACDGVSGCRVNIVKLEAVTDDIQWSRDRCNVNGELHMSLSVNYMVVKFTCQAFRFCDSIPEMAVPQMSVSTSNYPATVVTNPTCECTFKSSNDVSYVEGIVTCNGTVTFIAEEKIPNPIASGNPRYIKQTKRYFCQDRIGSKGYIRIGSSKTLSMTVSVDAKNSSEYSSYSINTHINVVKTNGAIERKRDAKVTISCVKGALYLSSTVRLILYIAVPLFIILLVVLIVVYCVIKKRRKRERKWRRRHIKLAQREMTHENKLEGRSTLTYRTDYKPESPIASESSSAPSTTRKKPEGKLDSDSDEDITAYARKLHRQNTERIAGDMKRRQLYYNNGIDGVWSQSHVQMPQQPHYTDLDHRQGHHHSLSHQPLYGERKCMSIGNLQHQPEVDDDNTNHRRRGHLARTGSAAYSTMNSRAHHYNTGCADPSYSSDNTSNTGRRYIPRSDSVHRRQQNNSDSNYPPVSLNRAKSFSQSRTSLRSLKRRAPQPPETPPLASPVSHYQKPANRVNSETPGHPDCDTGVPDSSQTQGGVLNNSKPNYYNRYAVRPPIKPKPKLQGTHVNGTTKAKTPSFYGARADNTRERCRYSEDGRGCYDDSDEDLSDGIHHIDIVGGDAGSETDDHD